MPLKFTPIKSGDKGAEVANNLLVAFSGLSDDINALSATTDYLQEQINKFKETPIEVDSSPVSVSMNPNLLYIPYSSLDTTVTVNVSVMRGDTELKCGTDDGSSYYELSYLTSSISSQGKVICTVTGKTNSNGFLTLYVTSMGGTNEDCSIQFTIKFKGHEYKQTLSVGISHKQASDGVGVFVSTIFIRTADESGPSTPYGGTYASPLPDGEEHQGWSDGIPEGTNPLWCSHRKFTSTGNNQDEYWSTPVKAFDNGDIDVAYSSYSGTPTEEPIGHPDHVYRSPMYWHNNGTSSDIWMAVSTKSGGVWGEWTITRVKGEKGDTGRAVITSYVFTRSSSGVTDQPTKEYGTFEKPNPTEDGPFLGELGTKWYDGIPEGNSAVYSSHRVFTNDNGSPAEDSWSSPILMADTDTMDVCYHQNTEDGSQPAPPSDSNHPFQGTDLTTWHDSGTTQDYWMATSIKTDGSWGKWQVMKIKGESGQACLTSYVFARSSSGVTDKPSSDCGEFYAPNPPETGWVGTNGTVWYDGVPNGKESVWMSSRLFTSDGTSPQQDTWSKPILLADTDSLDVCYHPKTDDDSQPDPPDETKHPKQGTDTKTWHDTANENDYWLAMSTKVGGTWSTWQVNKMKAEDGKPGASGLVVYFDPNIISATETDASIGMPTGTTYSKLMLYDNGIEIPSNREGLSATVLTDESISLDEIGYTFYERDNKDISKVKSYSGSSYYFWINDFKKSGHESLTGTVKFKIRYNGEDYYRSCSWMCNWLGTFRETISGDVDTRISQRLNTFIDDKGLITAVSAQSIFNQAASAITAEVRSLSGSVSGLSGSVAQLQITANKLSSSVSGLSGDVSTLQQTSSGIKSSVSGLSGDVSTLQQTANGLTLQVSSLSGSVSGLSGSVASLEVKTKGIDAMVKEGDTIGGLHIASSGSTFTGPVTATKFYVQTTSDPIKSVPDDISMVITTWEQAKNISSGTNVSLSSLEADTPVFLVRNGDSFFVLNPLLLNSDGSNPVYAWWKTVTLNQFSLGTETSKIALTNTITQKRFKESSAFKQWFQGYKIKNGTMYYTSATNGLETVNWVEKAFEQDSRIFADEDFDMENVIFDGIYLDGIETGYETDGHKSGYKTHGFYMMHYINGLLSAKYILYLSIPENILSEEDYVLCDKNGNEKSSMYLSRYLSETGQS